MSWSVRMRILLLVGWMVGLGAAGAQARDEVMRWTYPDDQFEGFYLYVGASPGSYGTPLDIGKPSRGADSTYQTTVSVADGATVYLAVSAYQGSETGPLSNERVRSPADPGGGGDTGGGGDPGGGGDTGGGGDPPPDAGVVAMLSTDGTDSRGISLDGARVDGELAVYVTPESGLESVAFHLDDPNRTREPVRIERVAPFSLGGDAGHDAIHAHEGLANGDHTLTLVVTESGGAVVVTTASFTLQGAAPPPQVVAPPVLLD